MAHQGHPHVQRPTSFLLAVATALLLVFGPGGWALAQDDDVSGDDVSGEATVEAEESQDGGLEEPFEGEEGPAEVEPTSPFDDSSRFVPPEELPIVDVYVGELVTSDESLLSDQLETVTITPEGEVERIPADPEDIQILQEALERLQEDLDADAVPEGFGFGEFEDGDPGSNEPELDQPFDEESVIGRDDRVRVTATTRYPFRTMGRIDIGCTGTLIGPRHVLTAGHCVYNIRNDRWYSSLNFSPGQNGSLRPYGTIGWRRAISVKGWTRYHQRNYDYAMIVLNQDIGNRVGWLGYGWRSPMPYYNVNINGYPGDKPSGTIWHSFCRFRLIFTFREYYACDTFNGESGSAVYVYFADDNRRITYGIHAYGVDATGFNGATRIRRNVFNNLRNWKSTY